MAGAPGESAEQLVRVDFQRPAEFGDGVDPGEADSSLKHPDLGPVQAGEESKLFLGEIGPVSEPG